MNTSIIKLSEPPGSGITLFLSPNAVTKFQWPH